MEEEDIRIELQSFDNQVTYARENLSSLAKSALINASNPEFRESVYQEVEKQFDGEYNVLFEKLMLRSTKDGSKLGQKITNTVRAVDDKLDVNKACQAFKQIRGRDYFPQIYIPFFEENKSKLQAKGAKGELPVVVIFTAGDDNKDKLPGYTLDKTNNLVDLGFLVDEEYAKKHEVWVISINERANNLNYKLPPTENRPGRGIRDNRTNPNGQQNVILTELSPYFWKMKVMDYKESWFSGGSEVRMRRVLSWANERPPVCGSEFTKEFWLIDNFLDTEFFNIREFSRNEVHRQSVVNVTRIYFSGWKPLNTDFCYSPNRGDHLFYVIFEFDPCPVGSQTAEITAPLGNMLNLDYRSEQIPYFEGLFSADTESYWYADYYIAGNNSIYFEAYIY